MKLVLKTTLLAFLLTWNLVFFLSIFLNFPYPRRQVHNQDYHYFIHRGYPIPWSGVSNANREVPTPLVKAPFIAKTTYKDSQSYIKIIDLNIFSKTFFLTFVIILVLLSIIFRSASFGKSSSSKYPLMVLSLLLLGTFLYFGWFPRL